MIYMKFTILEKHKDVVQGVSTRMNGMSEAPFATLNLGFHTEDDPDKVLLNREIFCNRLEISLDCMVCAKQTHGENITVIEKGDWGKGCEDYESGIEDTDAMVTNVPDIFLMVLVADCAAAVFYDPEKKAAGIAHAGWRSTLAGISGKTVAKMKEAFGSKPEDILCGIAPSIGPCCYEVKEDVVRSFVAAGLALPEATQALQLQKNSSCIEKREGKYYLNLWEINKKQVIDSGVKEENIEVSRLCSSCHSELFYSARKEGKTGRYGILIGTRKESL